MDHGVGDLDDQGIVDADEENLGGFFLFGGGLLLIAFGANAHLL